MAAKDYIFDPHRNPLVRGDYRPSEYKIDHAHLVIDLDDTATTVFSQLFIDRNPDMPDVGGPLVLNGEDLKLKRILIADEKGKSRPLDPQDYIVTAQHLIIKRPPATGFVLHIETETDPTANTSLSGLYKSGDLLTTQCEAQGFRRITYFLDRPDNLTTFNVTLNADKEKFPILLSNGNGDYKKTTDLGDGRHSVSWNDPWPKPSYLFALVAGDMKALEDTFTTMSGKKVDLRIFVQDGYEDKVGWAMESIKRSMKWDEQKYGREYDLDCFHVVATDKFNAGAMENKGLNIFNVKLLVGTPETSTDAELTAIEAVIGHEYFHNWTGNRVTVRDWFELTLKEGLTVLRDRQFTGDMHSQSIKLIEDATDLKSIQFIEDAGPTSHPIRPDIVEAFENIYTGTIYEKGSHVLGMLHTMMGENTWRAATDEYFNRFDGKAVSCDDFLDVMQDVSGIDLTQFRLWYSQSGTPEISYEGKYNTADKTYTLTLSQTTPPTHGQPVKQPLHMPIAVGLISESGKDALAEGTRILHLTDAKQTFVFENINGPVVPSILRGFSAPVKIVTPSSDEELVFRMSHDSDPFNRFAAAESLTLKTIHKMIGQYQAGKDMEVPPAFLNAYLTNIENALDGDLSFNAKMLQMPAYNLITQDMATIDPDAVSEALNVLRGTLADAFRTHFAEIYEKTAAPKDETYNVVPAQVGRRELHNLALSYIAKTDGVKSELKVLKQFWRSENMTEKIAALNTLVRMGGDKVEDALADFYEENKSNTNLVDKWLALKAVQPGKDITDRLRVLMQHPAYDRTNPNKVRALIGSFTGGNATAFHALDGSGYKFLADVVIEMNDINPKIAANLAGRFGQFKRYSEERQNLMVTEMTRIMATPGLDTGIKEIVGKALETAARKPANNNAKKAFKKTA